MYKINGMIVKRSMQGKSLNAIIKEPNCVGEWPYWCALISVKIQRKVFNCAPVRPASRKR